MNTYSSLALRITLLFNLCVTHAITLQYTHNITPRITHSLYNSTEFPLQAHVVMLPLTAIDVALVPAIGQREEVSSIARRSNALVAINGSNYRRGGKYNGNRVNLVSVDNCIIADVGLARGAFGWRKKLNAPVFDTVFLDTHLLINNVVMPVDAVNQPRAAGQAVIHNHCTDVTLLNHTPGKTIVIQGGFVRSIIQDEGYYKNPMYIPTDCVLYQVDRDALSTVREGDVASFSYAVKSRDFPLFYHDYDFIFAGAGLLIQDGEVVTDNLYKEFSQGNAIVHCGDEVAADFHDPKLQTWLIEQRHPRTAIGVTEHNEIIVVVADGRCTESEGLTLLELAQFMKDLGCVDALNIGGGGCSTLYVDGSVVNTPSDKAERPVSEALCFTNIKAHN